MKETSLKNVFRMPELTTTEANIAIVVGSYRKGELPSNQELAKRAGFKESTIKRALRTLRKKDMIEE